MCGTVTIEQYRRGYNGSKIVAEFTKPHGRGKQTAITVVDRVGAVFNIYSSDGTKYGYIYDAATTDENIVLAEQAMINWGFTKIETQAVTAATVEDEAKTQPLAGETIAVITEDEATQVDDGQVRVQGRTLEEWALEGELNEGREKHVHPAKPEGRVPTDDEYTAYLNSLTTGEALLLAIEAITEAETANVVA